MWKLFQHLLQHRTSVNRILVVDQDNPDRSDHFELRPFSLVLFLGTFLLLVLLASALLFYITPIGDLYRSPQTNQIREELFAIEKRVNALRDTISARDLQLVTLQRALRANIDTTFATSVPYNPESSQPTRSGIEFTEPWNSYEQVTQRGITLSNLSFQNLYLPADGTPSRSFHLLNEHYGIDFATRANAPFYAVEDGVVVFANWTLEYGYVVAIQHDGGYMSVYKHGSAVTREKGEYVFKGDYLGTVSDSGILSTGPHLHFELWKDGNPLDPAIYLPTLF